MRIVALTTCHNRRGITTNCLRDIERQLLPVGVSLSIVVVDDGSLDGTAASISAEFPDVDVVRGDGKLFWAGGMRYGWRYIKQNHEFDALIVFNDDIRIGQNALADLALTSRSLWRAGQTDHIVVGAFSDGKTDKVTYGGYRLRSSWNPLRLAVLKPNDTLQDIATFNMNLALISSETLNKIGFLARYFRHGGADIEYGHRARKAGVRQYLLPAFVGECARNSRKGTYFEPGINRIERLKRYMSVKAYPPLQRLRFCFEHGGLFWPLIWLKPYLQIIFCNRIN